MTDQPISEERLRELRALTERLPREITPPPAAWEAISAQIKRAGAALPADRVPDAAVWQRPAFLVAASLLLIVGSSAVTYRVASNRESPIPSMAEVAASGPSVGATVSTLSQFAGRENEYLRRVNGLVAIMESDAVSLAPETIAKVKESLAVIDAAIGEARAALASDPANRQLIEILEFSYEMKVDLLRRTTEMARS